MRLDGIVNRHLRILFLFLSTLLLLPIGGCGGGGGGSVSPPPVTQPPPPAFAISGQPKSATVLDGASASFSVELTGANSPTYQWMKNGTNVSGATSSTLTLAADYKSNGAKFSVAVKNSDGQALTSAEAILNVTPVAVSVQQAPAASIAAMQGDKVTLSVLATGTEPIAYQWQRNGSDVAGATQSTLILDNISLLEDGASYTLKLTNPAGSVSTTASVLKVSAKPVAAAIDTQPSDQKVRSGFATSMAVTASGTAPLSYQWFKNGVAITGATSAQYTLGKVTNAEHGAKFSVQVSNAAGPAVQSRDATLNVTPAIVQLATGHFHSLALTDDNKVWAWGSNANLQVGANPGSPQVSQPVRVAAASGAALGDIVAVAAGNHHSLALDSTGYVWSWGYGWYGALGDGNLSAHQSVTPARVLVR